MIQVLFTRYLSVISLSIFHTEVHLPLSYALKAQAIPRTSVRSGTMSSVASGVAISLQRKHNLNVNYLVTLFLSYKMKRSSQREPLGF